MGQRGTILTALAAVAAVTVTTATLRSKPATATGTEVVVYKSPTCGCCAKWVDHMEQNGFTVRVEDTNDLSAVKERFGVGAHLAACHTAVVGDHVFEGHVPADAIQRFLAEPPASAVGLAVPGMPAGSPGMESANPQPYDVVSFDRAGKTTLFEKR